MMHEILKDFPGSQDGSVTEQFVAGTKRDLSKYLADIVVPAGWARPIVEDPAAAGGVITADPRAKSEAAAAESPGLLDRAASAVTGGRRGRK